MRTFLLLFITFFAQQGFAQLDSIAQNLEKIPDKYFKNVNSKISTYSQRLSGKTEKTLERLARWETKLRKILIKHNPAVAENLFGNNQETFNSLLSKIKEGKSISDNYSAQYDTYRNTLSASIKYIEAKKEGIDSTRLKVIKKASNNIDKLEYNIDNSEVVEKFIKDRKDKLIDQSIKYLGKHKLLKKINKEAFYYTATLKNYKTIFSDQGKVEEMAFAILKKNPAFRKFTHEQSALNGTFLSLGGFAQNGNGAGAPIVNGIPSRAFLQQSLQQAMPSLNGVNPIQQLQAQLPDLKPQLDNLKKRMSEMGGMSNKNLPDFTPNNQKTKTFWQRVEYIADLQFGKSVNFLPATTDIGLGIGYKLNDKSSTGVGLNYKMGLGNGWNNIRLSSQGLGFRTFIKWKLVKGIDIQGGSEWNYLLQFKSISALKNSSAWKQSALLGLSKHYTISKKVKGNFQALYDFLYKKQLPQTQPFVFRLGYGF